MFGDEEYQEDRFPKELQLSPKVQIMEKRVDKIPEAERLPSNYCWRETSYCCCSDETKDLEFGTCKIRLISGIVKFVHTRAGMYDGGKFDRSKLVIYRSSPPGIKKGIVSLDLDIPSRDEHRNIDARICHKKDSKRERRPLLLYFYGGGFCTGESREPNSTAEMSVLAKEIDVVSLAISYRLSPEHPFPAAINDAYDLLIWIAKNKRGEIEVLQKLNVDFSRIIFVGTSAGANICLVMTTLLRDKLNTELKQAPKELNDLTIDSQVLFSPALLLPYPTPSQYQYLNGLFINYYQMRFYRNSYLPSEERKKLLKDRRVCPLFAGMDNLPRTILAYVKYDPLQHENLRLLELLKESNTELISRFFPRLGHGGFLLSYGRNSASSPFKFVLESLEKFDLNK